MSGMFTNINVRSDDQEAVAAAVKRLPRRMAAFVSPAENGWVTVFEESADAPDEDRLSGYTVMLSEKLQTAAIGFLVYESDVLIYTLAAGGKLLDHYSSWPDYFDENMPESEIEKLAGNEADLAQLKRGVTPAQVRAVLDKEHDFAEEKLADLVRLLGLPTNAAHWGYNDILDEEETSERPDAWDRFITLENTFTTL